MTTTTTETSPSCHDIGNALYEAVRKPAARLDDSIEKLMTRHEALSRQLNALVKGTRTLRSDPEHAEDSYDLSPHMFIDRNIAHLQMCPNFPVKRFMI